MALTDQDQTRLALAGLFVALARTLGEEGRIFSNAVQRKHSAGLSRDGGLSDRAPRGARSPPGGPCASSASHYMNFSGDSSVLMVGEFAVGTDLRTSIDQLRTRVFRGLDRVACTF